MHFFFLTLFFFRRVNRLIMRMKRGKRRWNRMKFLPSKPTLQGRVGMHSDSPLERRLRREELHPVPPPLPPLHPHYQPIHPTKEEKGQEKEMHYRKEGRLTLTV